MARTAAFWAAPSALLAWSWLRLGQPHAALSTAFWLIALALAPALLPRPRQRVLALVPASVLALHVALGVWLVHPLGCSDASAAASSSSTTFGCRSRPHCIRGWKA